MSNEIKISYDEWSELSDGDSTDRFAIEEKGEWIADGKYQYKTFVVKEKETGKYFSGTSSRSGSPFSDYEYADEYEKDADGNMTLDEVKKVPVTTFDWVLVKGGNE